MRSEYLSAELLAELTAEPQAEASAGVSAREPVDAVDGEAGSRAEPLWGIDVSSHQGFFDWSQLKGEGGRASFSFAFTKATEGTYYQNPTYAHNLKGMADNGILPGVYHYLTDEPAEAQLDNMFAVTGPIPKGVMVMVDVEEVPGMPPPTWPRIKQFVSGLKERLGDDRPIVVYSGRWFWAGGSENGRLDDPSVSELPGEIVVWDSNYFGGTGLAGDLYRSVPESAWTRTCWGGRRADILQFTYRALVAGQEMDANAFPGTVEDLKRIGGLGAGEPQPKPDPDAPRKAWVIEVPAQKSGGNWFDKTKADARRKALARLGVKSALKAVRAKAPRPKPEPRPPKPDPGYEGPYGPSTYGVQVEENGVLRRAAVYSYFNDYRPSAPAQIYHKGEDIECHPMAPQYLLFDAIVQAIWDYDSVGGYHQAILVYYPELGLYDLHGHIRAGVSKWYKAGDRVKRGDIIARGGTVYDAMGTAPHLHGQCSYDRAAAFALGSAFNNAAVDPATELRAKAKPFPDLPPGLAGTLAPGGAEEVFVPEAMVCGTDLAEEIAAQDEAPAFLAATSFLDPDGHPERARRIR
jgi:murein DD-endopeptidase MepM/ murein hydrolase activator NlpD